ncbi:MAG TPA: HesB/YadR/YfhF family protein [Bacillota bacterium]
MKIHVTKKAAQWYKEEFQLDKSAYVRFFTRYGDGGHLPGFSLGISKEFPQQIHISTTVEDITFYIEEKDAWYFQDKNVTVQLNEKEQEPEFIYTSD